VITWVFFINLCALIFQCGCDWLWAGAADRCNINHEEMRHCPLCVIGPVGYNGIVAAIIAVQSVLALGPWGWSLPVRSALTLGSFPLLGTAVGIGLGYMQGYWASTF
jgi:hypothetical protein